MVTATSTTVGTLTARRSGLLEKYFNFFMSLLIIVVVVYGFSFTVGKNLINPAVPRPSVLYVHAAVFTGWLVFFTLQSALVLLRKVQWHRRIGWFGAAMGIAMIVLGVVTRSNGTVQRPSVASEPYRFRSHDFAF